MVTTRPVVPVVELAPPDPVSAAWSTSASSGVVLVDAIGVGALRLRLLCSSKNSLVLAAKTGRWSTEALNSSRVFAGGNDMADLAKCLSERSYTRPWRSGICTTIERTCTC